MRELGKTSRQRSYFTAALAGSTEPAAALYYNDQPPDMILYQALAQRKLGAEQEAAAIAQGLVDYGERHLDEPVTVDYFAVSLPDFLVFDDDLQRRQRLHCLYMAGLGYLGLGETVAAVARFDAVLAEDPAHLGATVHRRLASSGVEYLDFNRPPLVVFRQRVHLHLPVGGEIGRHALEDSATASARSTRRVDHPPLGHERSAGVHAPGFLWPGPTRWQPARISPSTRPPGWPTPSGWAAR